MTTASEPAGANFLPEDETLLHLFEATSPDALRQAARDAALPYERIVEAVEGSHERQDTSEPSQGHVSARAHPGLVPR